MGNCSGKFFFSKNNTFKSLEIRQKYRPGFSNSCVNKKNLHPTLPKKTQTNNLAKEEENLKA